MKYDYLVVGAGLFGSVIAERIANVLDKKVLVIDKREHLGGNCYSEIDKETGISIHKYGTHIFHTDSELVWNYVNNFTKFNDYRHKVYAVYKNKIYQMPINLATINSFYDLNLNPEEAEEFIRKEAEKSDITEPKNLEEKAISLIGFPLYSAFIREYTIKQWQKDPKELPASIINRLPVRFNYDTNYFLNCKYQGLPKNGYTKMFENMLKNPKITVLLNTDYFSQEFEPAKKTIYSGPIDKLFDYKFGELEWRSIRLEKEIKPVPDFQGTAAMNFADLEISYTRIHEFAHLHPEMMNTSGKTVVCYEYSNYNKEEPFYPVRTEKSTKIYDQYRELVNEDKKLIVGGRLGSYEYLDMDVSIEKALNCFDKEICEK